MHVGIAVAAEDPYANQAPVPDSTSEFFESVQRAIRHDDAFGLANVVRYPLHVCRYKKLIPIRSKKEFVQNYRVIMNDITRETLLNQDPRKLLRNWEGVAADGGRMWLEEAGEWRDGEVRPVIVSMYNGPLPYLPQHPCLPWRK
jgi:hypothetical protein